MQEDKKAIHAAVKKQKYPCSARLIGVGREGELGCPSPPPLPLPLLSGDMYVCVHTHTHKYTLLRLCWVISLPLLFPIRRTFYQATFWKRQTGSLGRAFLLSPRPATAKQTLPREMPEAQLREPGLSQLIQTPTQTILASLT